MFSMGNQAESCFIQPGCEEVGWLSFDGQQGSASDAELSSFLDFILSQDAPDLFLPPLPEIDPFAGLALDPDQGFGLQSLVSEKGSPCNSGLSVNLEGHKTTDSRTGNQAVPSLQGLAAEGSPNGCSSLSATEGEEGLGFGHDGHDGLSSGSRAVERGQMGASDTDQQDDDARRQNRLMKNRESALQSRQRKKSYLKDLEAKCRMLESHCHKLEQAMAYKNVENCVLKEELVRAKRLKGQKGVSLCAAEPAVLEKDSLPLESLSHRTYNSDGHYLVWMVPLLFLLLLLHVQGAPIKDRSGGSTLNMGKSSRTNDWNRKRGLPSAKGGGRGRARSMWRWKCFAHNKRRKKRRSASSRLWWDGGRFMHGAIYISAAAV